MVMKVAINRCFGGFSISDEACELYIERKGLKLYSHVDPQFGKILGKSYTTVPTEEYERLYALDRADGRYHRSNPVCWSKTDIERNDPVLIQIIEELGERANGRYAKISIVEIPDGIDWEIDEYDGMETIDEKHRSWS